MFAVPLLLALHRSAEAQTSPVTVTPICDVGWLLEWEPVRGAIEYRLVQRPCGGYAHPCGQPDWATTGASILIPLGGTQVWDTLEVWVWALGPGPGDCWDVTQFVGSVYLSPQRSPVFLQSLAPVTRYDPNERLEFSVASLQSDLQFEWLVNGVPVQSEAPTRLTFPAGVIQPGDSIVCRVTDVCGIVETATIAIPDDGPIVGLAQWHRVVRDLTGNPESFAGFYCCPQCNCVWPISVWSPWSLFTSERASWTAGSQTWTTVSSEATGRKLTLVVNGGPFVGVSLESEAVLAHASSVAVGVPPAYGTGTITITSNGQSVVSSPFGPSASVNGQFVLPPGVVKVVIQATPMMEQINACGLMAPWPIGMSATLEFRSLADCNGNGVADWLDIVSGVLTDADGNGIPDTCECRADIVRDGVVNAVDLAAVIGAWGTNGLPLGADITGDGVVNANDLAAILGSWGPCP